MNFRLIVHKILSRILELSGTTAPPHKLSNCKCTGHALDQQSAVVANCGTVNTNPKLKNSKWYKTDYQGWPLNILEQQTLSSCMQISQLVNRINAFSFQPQMHITKWTPKPMTQCGACWSPSVNVPRNQGIYDKAQSTRETNKAKEDMKMSRNNMTYT